MDLTLSEAVAHVQAWEMNASPLNVMVLSDSSEMVVKFAGCVTIKDDVITSADQPLEFRLSLTPTMIFKYADAVLEIRALGWHCILYEPRV